MVIKSCLRCGAHYELSAGTLWPEVFCTVECEKEFALHVLRFHGVGFETRILAAMPPGRA
jgi:hypothetical protein